MLKDFTVYTYIYAKICVRVHACIYIEREIYTYTVQYMYTYTYACTCALIYCMHIYIYLCIGSGPWYGMLDDCAQFCLARRCTVDDVHVIF